jgi:DNA-binding transcriptional MerR regulator
VSNVSPADVVDDDSAEAPARAWTVEELAARAGTTVRTIRYYQSEGLLPAPARIGRSARYEPAHLDRLGLITRLQERGLRLAAIADLLRHGDAATVEEWTGLGEHLNRPWSDDRPQVLSHAELEARASGAPAGTVDDLVRTGVVEHRDDTTPAVYFVPSPGLLDIALELVGLGVDLHVGARLRDLLHRRLGDMATELVAGFTEEVSVERLAGSGPAALAALLEQLQPLTRRTVDLLFAHEMERAQRELVQLALTDPADPEEPR